MRRREFLRTTGGLTAGAAAVGGSAGVVGAQETTRPDFGGYLDGIDGGFRDARGESEVVVGVGADGNGGAYAFEPAGLWVDAGTTVVWEWTGEGASHNVHAVSGAEFQSETTASAGFTFEYTFEEGGIVEYQCDPHEALGMVGAVAVGNDIPTTTAGGGGGGGEVDPHEMGVPFHPHFVGVVTILMIMISLIFTFFFLKYGETPHSGFPERD